MPSNNDGPVGQPAQVFVSGPKESADLEILRDGLEQKAASLAQGQGAGVQKAANEYMAKIQKADLTPQELRDAHNELVSHIPDQGKNNETLNEMTKDTNWFMAAYSVFSGNGRRPTEAKMDREREDIAAAFPNPYVAPTDPSKPRM